MFNRKKKEIERLYRLLDVRCSESDRVFQQYSFYYKQCEALRAERDEVKQKLADATADRNRLFDENEQLMRSNGTLKRDLDDSRKTADELAEKIKALAERTMCHADCRNKFTHNGCRTCVRYPYKKDKYEGGDNK